MTSGSPGAAILAVLGCLGVVLGATTAGGRSTIDFREGRFTVEVSDASLYQVVQEIGQLSGAAVSGLAATSDQRISVRFDALPLREALERLLGSRSFLIVTSGTAPATRVTRIVILPGGSAVPALPPAFSDGHDADFPPETAPDGLLAAALDHVEPGARLGTIRDLAAAAPDDPRAAAVLADISRRETDPEVRAAAERAHAAAVRARRRHQDVTGVP